MNGLILKSIFIELRKYSSNKPYMSSSLLSLGFRYRLVYKMEDVNIDTMYLENIDSSKSSCTGYFGNLSIEYLKLIFVSLHLCFGVYKMMNAK